MPKKMKKSYCLFCLTEHTPKLTVVRKRFDDFSITEEPVAGCDVCDMDLYVHECLTIEEVKDYIDYSEEHIKKVRALYEAYKDKW